MTFSGWATIVLFALILSALALPLGHYMARVYTGQRVFLSPIFAGPERFIYRLLRVDPETRQDWKKYAKSLLLFSLAGWLLLYVILRTQTLWDFTGSIRRATNPAPGTSPSTRPRRSSRTPTGSTTAARPRSATSARWSA